MPSLGDGALPRASGFVSDQHAGTYGSVLTSHVGREHPSIPQSIAVEIN